MERLQQSTSTSRLPTTASTTVVSTSPTASRVSVNTSSQSRLRSSNGNLAGEGVPLPLDKRVNRSSKDSLSAAPEKTPPSDPAPPAKKDDEVCTPSFSGSGGIKHANLFAACVVATVQVGIRSLTVSVDMQDMLLYLVRTVHHFLWPYILL